MLKLKSSLFYIRIINGNIKVIEKGEPLFIRLDKDEELEYIKEGMSSTK